MKVCSFVCDICGKNLEQEKKATKIFRIKKYIYHILPFFSWSPFDVLFANEWVEDDDVKKTYDCCKDCHHEIEFLISGLKNSKRLITDEQ